MPRDLFPTSSPPPANLVSSPESKTPSKSDSGSPPSQFHDDNGEEDEDADNGFQSSEFTIHRDERQLSIQMLRDNRAKADDRNDLHPYVQTLSLSNLDSCVALEEAIFPEQERCTKEKFVYRLTACPELCLGLFSTITAPSSPSSPSTSSPSSTTPAQPTKPQPQSQERSTDSQPQNPQYLTPTDIPTFSTARPAFSPSPTKKSVLIAMIIATKTSTPYVSDASMSISTYPTRRAHSHSYTSPPPPAEDAARGHKEDGRTICVHSFGVLPGFQGRGLGKVLIKSYLQRMEGSGIADRVALIAHEGLVGMYRGMGFKEEGKSDVQFGGGGWTNLIYEFIDKGPGL